MKSTNSIWKACLYKVFMFYLLFAKKFLERNAIINLLGLRKNIGPGLR